MRKREPPVAEVRRVYTDQPAGYFIFKTQGELKLTSSFDAGIMSLVPHSQVLSSGNCYQENNCKKGTFTSEDSGFLS